MRQLQHLARSQTLSLADMEKLVPAPATLNKINKAPTQQMRRLLDHTIAVRLGQRLEPNHMLVEQR